MDFHTYALYAALGLISSKPNIVKDAIVSTIVYVLNLEGYEVETPKEYEQVKKGVEEAFQIELTGHMEAMSL